MKLTDASAIRALEKTNILELIEMVDYFPESDVNGRTDWEMVANEAGWLLDSYNSDNTARNEALQEAREVLSRSRRGKPDHFGRPYKEMDVRFAKDQINEYNRLVRFVAKLKGMGLYCPYC